MDEDEDGRAKNEQAQLVSSIGTLCCLWFKTARDSVASECPQGAAMQSQRLGREDCRALEFWQLQAPKMKASLPRTTASSTKARTAPL